LPLALQNFKHYNVKIACVMLGTNDSRIEIAESSEAFRANIEYIIHTLKSAGVEKIILNTPPYFEIIPLSWEESSREKIKEYIEAEKTLADNKTIFLGDTLAWETFEKSPSLLWDGLHPNQEGYKVLGNLWANAFKKLIK
jgi:lysophospholipase L1-like esterase